MRKGVTGMVADRGLGWWYWLGMVVLLGAGVSGWDSGIPSAIALGAIQILHFAWLERTAMALSVQVRAVYLVLLLLGQWEPMSWIHWVQLIGTSARMSTGYCLLARLTSLLPWNRTRPLSRELVCETLFSLRPAVRSCGDSCAGAGARRAGKGAGVSTTSCSRRLRILQGRDIMDVDRFQAGRGPRTRTSVSGGPREGGCIRGGGPCEHTAMAVETPSLVRERLSACPQIRPRGKEIH